ncbi:MAG: hypothetical protein RLY46_108 [Bacteroidota bacterium]|jgi:hypothetical protein
MYSALLLFDLIAKKDLKQIEMSDSSDYYFNL